MSSYFKQVYRVELQEQAVSVKGWNWGDVHVSNNMLQFDAEGGRAFEVPLNEVSNVSAAHNVRANKHELGLELQQSDTFGDADTLVELKLYVPPKTGPIGKTALDADGNAGADDDAGVAAASGEKSRAQLLTDAIEARANTAGASATPIVTFKEMFVITPRQKCDLAFYSTYFEMSGAQRLFKVLYTHVSRLITLSKPDGKTVIFIVSLDPPILQGHTTYPHLVLHISVDDEVSLPVTLQDEMRVKLGAQLGTEVTGSTVKALGQLFLALTGKKPTTAAKEFKSGTVSHVVETDEKDADGNVVTKRLEVQSSAIRCIYKANVGLLYPLANSFFFVYKPPVYFRHDEIDNVEFATAETQRNFDLIFNMKNGTSMLFSALQRPDFKPLYEFLRSKNIAVKTAEHTDGGSKSKKARIDDDDDDDDDDDGPIDDGDGFNMGSESEDEDFEDKGVTEEVSEEYATPDESVDGDGAPAENAAAAANDDDDDDGGADAAPKEKKKAKKEKKKRADNDDDDDEDSAAKAERKKAKKAKKAAKAAAAAAKAAAGEEEDGGDEDDE